MGKVLKEKMCVASKNTEKRLQFYPRKIAELGLSWNVDP